MPDQDAKGLPAIPVYVSACSHFYNTRNMCYMVIESVLDFRKAEAEISAVT